MDNVDDIMRIMQSLTLLVQESAETGNMDASVHADMAELLGFMISRAQDMIRDKAA